MADQTHWVLHVYLKPPLPYSQIVLTANDAVAPVSVPTCLSCESRVGAAAVCALGSESEEKKGCRNQRRESRHEGEEGSTLPWGSFSVLHVNPGMLAAVCL